MVEVGDRDQPADCPEAEARHGQTGSGYSRVVDRSDYLTSLPIVLKPKPATVRLEVVYRDQPADCPEAEARHGQTGSGYSRVVDRSDYLTSLPIVLKPKPATVRLEVVYRDQPADCPEAEARHGQTGSGYSRVVDRSDYLTSLPIVLKPKPATVRLEVVNRSGLKWWVEASTDCPKAEARYINRSDYLTSLPIVLKPKPAIVRLEVVNRSGLKRLPIVLKPKPAISTDCPKAEARYGQTRSGLKWWIDGSHYLTSLPIVLKPKPATVRLEVVDRSGLKWWVEARWIEVDGCIGLLDQSADCPEAEARHGQTGSGLSRWFIGVVDRSGLLDQSADCPEAEARHGQTGSGLKWWVEAPADCPEAIRPATIRLERWIEVDRWIGLLDQPADCPEAIRPATVRLEVVCWSGLLKRWIEVDGWPADCPEALRPATVRLEVDD
ncbi:hypothetical protein N7534_012039 [Penicillium rubens]|nr:hypothetical protein N7534_012039 [Penicillium rubens]